MTNSKLEETLKEHTSSRTIENVQRIERSDSKLHRKADIQELVEEPLISACEALYDLNICTWRSSCAHPDDLIRGAGIIAIDFPSLSVHNKIVAQQLVDEGKAEFFPEGVPLFVTLKIPLHKNSSIREVSERALELTTRFSKQKMSWVTSFSLEDVRKKLKSAHMSPEEISRETKLYYDAETQSFFINEEQCIKSKEKIVPNDSDFLFHSIQPSDTRDIGFTMFEEQKITFTEQDVELLSQLWQEVSENIDYKIYLDQLSTLPFLTAEENSFISCVAAVITKLNGQQIGESATTKEQLRILTRKRKDVYKNTDMNEIVSLRDIQGLGIVMCAEASLIGQALSQYAGKYHVASAEVVSRADSDQAEGHQVIFLISDDETRVILVDLAWGVVRRVNENNLLIPFVYLLSKDQIHNLELGENTVIDAMNEKRTYRIGTRHTPPGTWKSQLVL